MPPHSVYGAKSMKFRFLWITDSIKALSILGRLTRERGAAWQALPFQLVLTPWIITSSDPSLEPPAMSYVFSCPYPPNFLCQVSSASSVFLPLHPAGSRGRKIEKTPHQEHSRPANLYAQHLGKEAGKWGVQDYPQLLSLRLTFTAWDSVLKKPKDYSEPWNPIFWRLEADWDPSG